VKGATMRERIPRDAISINRIREDANSSNVGV
jgi:hypothetical protein